VTKLNETVIPAKAEIQQIKTFALLKLLIASRVESASKFAYSKQPYITAEYK